LSSNSSQIFFLRYNPDTAILSVMAAFFFFFLFCFVVFFHQRPCYYRIIVIPVTPEISLKRSFFTKLVDEYFSDKTFLETQVTVFYKRGASPAGGLSGY
jgi:hypothetical protein